MVKPAFAQSIPKPPFPQFTLKFIDASYDMPTTYSTNPYTGENVTHQGYHVDNRTIEISILNSNFAATFDKLFFLYYNVQIKGHSVENWTNLLPYVPDSPSGLLPQSDSQYTIISESVQSLPTNVPLDFRVQSFLVNQTLNFDIIGTSDWSNTQTITMPTSSASTSPNQTQSPTNTVSPTPTVPEISWLAILLLFVATLFIAVKLRHRKTAKIPVLPLKALITQKPIFP
jgi:hypothetical protein